MIRDRQPRYTLGFGVRSDQVLYGEEEGPNPESGFLGRALHDDPIMRFFAVSAATIVSAHLAGSLFRRGGHKLMGSLAQSAASGKQWSTNVIRDFRKVQEILDDYQGVTRTQGPTIGRGADGLPVADPGQDVAEN